MRAGYQRRDSGLVTPTSGVDRMALPSTGLAGANPLCCCLLPLGRRRRRRWGFWGLLIKEQDPPFPWAPLSQERSVISVPLLTRTCFLCLRQCFSRCSVFDTWHPGPTPDLQDQPRYLVNVFLLTEHWWVRQFSLLRFSVYLETGDSQSVSFMALFMLL